MMGRLRMGSLTAAIEVVATEQPGPASLPARETAV
jgi:hypothetical protein